MFRKKLKRFVKSFCANQVLCILFVLAYLLGIVLGVVFGKNLNEYSDLFVIVNNYHTMIIGLYSNPIKLTFTRIINNLFYFFLLWVLCVSIYLSAFVAVTFFYRGLVLGNVFFLFFNEFAIHGIIIYIFIVLAQNLMVTFSLLFSACIVYDMRLRYRKGYLTSKYFKYFGIGLCLSFVGALYELILLITFFRPLNIYF